MNRNYLACFALVMMATATTQSKAQVNHYWVLPSNNHALSDSLLELNSTKMTRDAFKGGEFNTFSPALTVPDLNLPKPQSTGGGRQAERPFQFDATPLGGGRQRKPVEGESIAMNFGADTAPKATGSRVTVNVNTTQANSQSIPEPYLSNVIRYCVKVHGKIAGDCMNIFASNPTLYRNVPSAN